MTTYAVALTDSKTGSQAYLAKTAEERFDESYIAFRGETLEEVAKFVLDIRGAKRYTPEGEWREVPRRFVQVHLMSVHYAGTSREYTVNYPDVIVMGDLPEWIAQYA